MRAQRIYDHKRADPVVPDQGGRMMPSDPRDPCHLSTLEAIRARAYEIYEARGRQPGRALDDWVKAEAELAGAITKPQFSS
jgi:hypothetical protein